MLVLFAKKDIDQPNLKVRAGYPLPARFQQSYMTMRSLKETLGSDAIIPFSTEDTHGYVLVEGERLAALERENAQLKQHLAAKGKAKETQ